MTPQRWMLYSAGNFIIKCESDLDSQHKFGIELKATCTLIEDDTATQKWWVCPEEKLELD